MYEVGYILLHGHHSIGRTALSWLLPGGSVAFPHQLPVLTTVAHPVDIPHIGPNWKRGPRNTKKRLQQRKLNLWFDEERVRLTLLGREITVSG
jgi:hypothetical protein